MISRLILYRPIPEDDARAATAWAAKLGSASLTIEYRSAPEPMRLLLFDAVNLPDRPRRDRVRMLTNVVEPEGPAAAVIREAVATGEVVFNVYTGNENNRATSYSPTDITFTVGLPSGEGVVWFRRGAGGIAPGIAVDCLSPAWASGYRGEWKKDDWRVVREAARHLFFKRQPASIRQDERIIIDLAVTLLDQVPAGD